ncbi:hypothetical protein Holit_02050 [Hollandina sp. SP2]
MKKLLAVCIIGLSLGTMGAFAQHPDGWGIGIQGGFGTGGGGAALSLKVPSLPIFWTGRLSFGGSSKAGKESHFGIGVSGDYYFFDQALVPDIGLGWYLGGGAFVGYYNNTWHAPSGFKDWSYSLLQIGGELPIGLSWMIPIPVKLELYLQGVPNIGVQIAVADENDNGPDLFWFDIGVNVGIRIWL